MRRFRPRRLPYGHELPYVVVVFALAIAVVVWLALTTVPPRAAW